MDNRDPMERLSSAYRVEVAEDTKTRHIAEMGAALKAAPPALVPTGFALRRRLAGALAAVFVVVAPVGMAVAAEDSVPGDILYPMKQATERVRAVFDDEVEATHRVEEVERLVFLRALGQQSPGPSSERRAPLRSWPNETHLVLVSRMRGGASRSRTKRSVASAESAESRSRDEDESNRQSDADRQGEAPGPGQQSGSEETSEGSGQGTRQSGANDGSGPEAGRLDDSSVVSGQRDDAHGINGSASVGQAQPPTGAANGGAPQPNVDATPSTAGQRNG